jgi:hypothetical protein
MFGQQEALFQSLAFTSTPAPYPKVEVRIFKIGDFCGYLKERRALKRHKDFETTYEIPPNFKLNILYRRY